MNHVDVFMMARSWLAGRTVRLFVAALIQYITLAEIGFRARYFHFSGVYRQE